ncbi:MAG: hypothetical protein QJ16_C0017G0006 [archaeon GW2011_AR1]|nr:MAG: hypothetical protein QJ16_C0017G0006 [archaeon GW2011_AR1]
MELKKKYNYLKEYITLFAGIIFVAFGLKSFLIPNGFIDGGVTGIFLLISFLTPITLDVLIFILNVPFFFLAKQQIGKQFAVKTASGIFILAIILRLVEFPLITQDKLLVAIFGGFFIGAGIGLSVRGGSVLDGTEILSIYLNKKIGLSMGEIIFGLNIVIFSVAAFFLGIEVALYSILTYIIASKTVDFVSQGLEEYRGLTIISDKSSEIRRILIQDLNKGVTVYLGEKGHLSENRKIEILFTVITRLEIVKIKDTILSVDPSALIIEQNISEFHGGFIKKRKKHI